MPTHSPLRLRSSAVLLAGVAFAMALSAAGPLEAQSEAEAASRIQTVTEILEWESLGPHRGGRSLSGAGSTARPSEYYFGATGGGLWKTTDGGTTWFPVTDGQIGSASVGAVAVCEADPDVVYIGTGETQLRGHIQKGDGIYKSEDGGETWRHVGLEAGENVARIRIAPDDCDRAYAAVLGRHEVPSDTRGIYRTTDGGGSWQRVLHRGDEVGGADLALDPSDPDVVYASLWRVYRKVWTLQSGGEGSGLFKSTDGGDSWNELTRNPGMPEGTVGKIGVAVSADPNRVYALVSSRDGGLFRSDDGGGSWERVNDSAKIRHRAFYFGRIVTDPANADRVYALNTSLYVSEDAGATFDTVKTPHHGDHHDLWIAPDDPDRMLNTNDGGGEVSVNRGETWTELDYPTGQFYQVATTSHSPYFVCGAQQDNSTACLPSQDWSHLQARGPGSGPYYFSVGGCESGYVAPHPERSNLYFAGCYGGGLSFYDHETGQSRGVDVWPVELFGASSLERDERFQWTFPIVFSPHDPEVVYVASQHVWRSEDHGQGWTRISPDLTRADTSKMGHAGGPILRDETGVEVYATVYTLAPSPHDPEVIWAGSDDGLVHLTRDGGESWEEVTPESLPPFTKINMLSASPHEEGVVYLAANRYLVDGDRTPYVYRTDDFGQSWTDLGANLPDDQFARVVREDPVRRGLLFATTEKGVHVSLDDGRTWNSLQRNLPVTRVTDLVVEDDDLVISTYGRGFYVMRNVGVLREVDPAAEASKVKLFRPAAAVADVDPGAVVDYVLEEPADSVRLEIRNATGQVVRVLSAHGQSDGQTETSGTDDLSRSAGAHRFVWNLRYPGYRDFEGLMMFRQMDDGPRAVPGEYVAALTADGVTVSRPFAIRMDPRLEGVTRADLRARFELAMEIRDAVTAANEGYLRARNIRDSIRSRLNDVQDEELLRLGSSLADGLTALAQELNEERLRRTPDVLHYGMGLNNELAGLMAHVEGAEAPPTDASYDVFEELSAELDGSLERLDRLLSEDLSELNRRLEAAGRRPVTVPGM